MKILKFTIAAVLPAMLAVGAQANEFEPQLRDLVNSNIRSWVANSVVIDPADSARIFVGMDVGVFESTDGGDSFTAAMSGFPLGTVVTDLEIDDDPHVLTAGTYGRGAWQVDLDVQMLFTDGFESGDTSAWSLTVP